MFAVKASTPLWTAGLAYVLFGERQPARVQHALVLIAGGVGVASATEQGFDAAGLGAALAAAALLSLQHIYSKRALRDSGLHHLRLLLALSQLAVLLLLPCWAWSDLRALAQAQGGWRELGGWRTGSLLAADGSLAWLQAVLAFSVLSRVSPLGYAVASAAKRVAVVGASLAVLRNPAPPLNLAGMALAAAGVFAYNRAKLKDEPPTPRPLLPV